MRLVDLAAAFSLLFLSSCASTPNVPDPAEAWSEGGHPQRLVLIVSDELPPTATGSGPLGDLAQKGLSFQTTVGHLSTSPAISWMTLLTGKQPKHLPWSDELFRAKDSAKSPVRSLGQISPVKIAEELRQKAPTLFELFPEGHRGVVCSTPACELVFKGQKAHYDYAMPKENPGLLATDYLKSNPGWRVLVVDVKSSETSLDSVLAIVLKDLENSGVLQETAIAVTALKAPNPPISKTAWAKAIPASLVQSVLGEKHLQFFLKDRSPVSLLSFCSKARGIEGMTDVYYRQTVGDRSHFIRTHHNTASGPSDEHTQELLDSIAMEGSPDVVVLLSTSTTKESIPFVLWSPSMRLSQGTTKADILEKQARQVDIPVVLADAMRLSLPDPDGSPLGIRTALVE